MKLFLLPFLALALPLHADQWTYFQPELVERISCTVSAVNVEVHGVDGKNYQWVAEAHAEYTPPSSDKWAMEIGVFPMNSHGLTSATKVCTQWVEKASKRIRTAHQKGGQ